MANKTPSASSSPPRPQIKKENNEEEIKEFAETAMNELLGWYGYERLELRRWAASRARCEAASPDSRQQENKENADECAWCNKSMPTEGSGGTALKHAGATFCSEVCFSQSRRANFKRAKTCDWCRHVRHTVSYVDFQDGATQLQFCSDKCLNQYKMHIFCRETQAHLDLNPHLAGSSSSSNLITPELWLKNCKSRSASPTSDRTPSPNSDNVGTSKISSKRDKADPISLKFPTRKSPMPLITVAPTSKLMKRKGSSDEILLQKSPDHKKEIKSNKIIRKRRTSKCSATVTSQTMSKQNRSSTPKAQDLRMYSPSTVDTSSPSASSTIGTSSMHSPNHPINSQPLPSVHTSQFPNTIFGMSAPMFMDNLQHNHLNEHRLTNNILPPPTFMPRPSMPFQPERLALPPRLLFPQIGQPPPVTVLVPYPVPLPIPFPIPIPIPITSFLQAFRTNNIKVEPNKANDDQEGPLDFTINNDRKQTKEQSPSRENGEDATSKQNPEVKNRLEEEVSKDAVNPEQTLPKFKITRVGSKLAKIITRPRETSESSRPLRKRRRLVEGPSEEESSLIPKTRKIVQV